MNELESAVKKVLEEDLLSIKSEQMWDGDCYIYSVKTGDTVLLRTYDPDGVRQIRGIAEEGRQALFTDPERINDIKDLAYAQWSLSEDASSPFIRSDVAISFDYHDMNITNPWIDESARFPLSDAEAISTYGEVNIGLFILMASDRMAIYSSIQKQLHDPDLRKKAGLEAKKAKPRQHRAR